MIINNYGQPQDPFAPLGQCAQCGAAAWATTQVGLLCPSHYNVLIEAEEEAPIKEVIRVMEGHGRRVKLVGFRAVFDGADLPRLYATRDEAQRALDEIAYDEAAHAGAYALKGAA